MKVDVQVLMQTFQDVDDARLKYQVGRLLRTAVNRWTLGERVKKNVVFTNLEIDYLRAGRKLDCVREVRNRTDMSLFDAKCYVEKNMGPYYIAPVQSYSSNLQS